MVKDVILKNTLWSHKRTQSWNLLNSFVCFPYKPGKFFNYGGSMFLESGKAYNQETDWKKAQETETAPSLRSGFKWVLRPWMVKWITWFVPLYHSLRFAFVKDPTYIFRDRRGELKVGKQKSVKMRQFWMYTAAHARWMQLMKRKDL